MTIPLVISERRQTYLANCSGEKLAEVQQQSFDHESWRKNDIGRVAVLITQRRGNRAAVIVVTKQVAAPGVVDHINKVIRQLARVVLLDGRVEKPIESQNGKHIVYIVSADRRILQKAQIKRYDRQSRIGAAFDSILGNGGIFEAQRAVWTGIKFDQRQFARRERPISFT